MSSDSSARTSSMARVPDAWDDDYEAVVDVSLDTSPLFKEFFLTSNGHKHPKSPASQASAPPKVSRAERKAQHAEANRALWDSAENPETFHFIETRSKNVPLKSDFKPALKVLSRKPKPQQQPGQFPANGSPEIQQHFEATRWEPDDDYDSEEEARRERERTLEEKQQQTKREREQKQRKYDEVRQRLFGSSSQANGLSSGKDASTTPGSAPKARSKAPQQKRVEHCVKEQPSSREMSPARLQSTNAKQLFDPGYTPKPSSRPAEKNQNGARPGQSHNIEEPQIIRSPRGPHNIGKGGAGFVQRNSKPAMT